MADVFQIRVEGAGARARDFSRTQRAIQDGIIREFRALKQRLEGIYEDVAPEDRGIIRENLRVAFWTRAAEPRITVRSSARDPESGYAYVRVTRFGHRKAVIVPKRRLNREGRPAMLKVHYMGHRNPHIFVFRPSVRGASPSFDWVEQGAWLVDNAVDVAQHRLGRTIVRGVLS